jgi:YD repeat-containing protein
VNPAGNNPPTVNITSPANGAMFTAPANITINASASDTDGSVTQVQFFQGATLLGTDTTAPYSFTRTGVPAGSYSLTGKATDNGGATTTSSAVGITVNPPGNNPPTVSITSPANGATFTAPANITINATASDSDGSVTQVQFFQGATLLGTDTTAPYSFTWTSVPTGSYSLTAKATDNLGATTTSSAVSITVTGGGSPVPSDGLASVSYNQATNRIITAGWEYDAAGNQTRLMRADGTWQRHVFDAAGRLVKVQDNASQTQIINTYGASNHRLIEQIGDESSNQRTYYAFQGDSVVAEFEETAAAPTTPRWVKSYVYRGARLLAVSNSGCKNSVSKGKPGGGVYHRGLLAEEEASSCFKVLWALSQDYLTNSTGTSSDLCINQVRIYKIIYNNIANEIQSSIPSHNSGAHLDILLFN